MACALTEGVAQAKDYAGKLQVRFTYATTDAHPATSTKKGRIPQNDGKERNIQHVMVTSFWHPNGTPMSAHQFLEMRYGKLPEYFKNEAELREIWSEPERAPGCWKDWPKKVLAKSKWLRCKK